MTTGDLDEFLGLHAEPEIARFISVYDRQRAMERLRASDREWAQRGHGLLAIVERLSGRFLGRIGLKYWPQFDETEVGWVLRLDAWGQGFATEAGKATIAWGFRQTEVEYLTAMIRPGNTRSIRVAERLGMTPLRTDVLFNDPVVIYCLRQTPPKRIKAVRALSPTPR